MSKTKPGWFKLYVMHGPGHQSCVTAYLYAEDKDDLEWQTEKLLRDKDWPVYSLRVKALNQDTHRMLMARYQSQIDHGEAMLKILKRTPIKKKREK